MLAAETNLTVGRVEYAPDYRFRPTTGGYVPTSVSALEGTLRIPPAANDNHVLDRPRLIGLMGFAGAGKTEAAKRLRTRHGFSGPHIKTPLANMFRSLLRDIGYSELEIEQIVDGKRKRDVVPELRRTSTEIQQYLGTEFGRDFCYTDLWVDIWAKTADKIIAKGGRVVQESVRFSSEADAIRSRGGLIVLIDRPGVGPLSSHASEALPVEPDVVVHNNGTVPDLQQRIDEVAQGTAA